MQEGLNLIIDANEHITCGFDSHQRIDALRRMDSYKALDESDKANIRKLFQTGTLDRRFDLNSRAVGDNLYMWHSLTIMPDEYVFLVSYENTVEATAPDKDAELALEKMLRRICDDASNIAFSIPAVMVGYARHSGRRLIEETMKSDRHMTVLDEKMPNFEDDDLDDDGHRHALRIRLIHMDQFFQSDYKAQEWK